MATKTTGKDPQERQRPVGPSPEEIQTAYQVHTLAQMLYGHLATTQPWAAPTSVHGGYEPMMTHPTPPIMHGWPGMWGYPYGWYR